MNDDDNDNDNNAFFPPQPPYSTFNDPAQLSREHARYQRTPSRALRSGSSGRWRARGHPVA